MPVVNIRESLTRISFVVCTSLSKDTGEVVMKAMFVPSMKTVVRSVGQVSIWKMGSGFMSMKKNKSIIDDDKLDECYLCGSYGLIDEHHIFGGPVRKAADRLGLVVQICRDCHRDLHDKGGATREYLHRVGQRTYEQKIGTRDEFIRDFIRSYL